MLKGIIAKSLVTAVLVFGSVALRAQETAPVKAKASCSKTCTKGKGMKKQAFINSLSEDQKATYAALEQAKKDKRTALEATFTPEQLAIAKNDALDKKAKRESLRATYTDAQKGQMKANKEEGRVAKEAFIATLSEEQKALMPKGGKGKGKKCDKKEKQERKG